MFTYTYLVRVRPMLSRAGRRKADLVACDLGSYRLGEVNTRDVGEAQEVDGNVGDFVGDLVLVWLLRLPAPLVQLCEFSNLSSESEQQVARAVKPLPVSLHRERLQLSLNRTWPIG